MKSTGGFWGVEYTYERANGKEEGLNASLQRICPTWERKEKKQD